MTSVHGPYGPVNSLLEKAADDHGESVALIHGEKSWTYAQIEEQANQLARLLVGRGVKPGDRVGLMCENGIEAVRGLFGILKAGACAVALTSANKAPTNNRLLRHSGAVALVTRAQQVRRHFHQLVENLPALKMVVLDRADPRWGSPALTVVTDQDWSAQSTQRLDLALTQEDLCSILYTSGSTGDPRGATLSHGNLAANTRQILAYLKLQPQDRVLAVLPFHYSFGNSLLLTHFAVGGTVVVDNRFAYPQTIVETMSARKVTGFSGVPSTYAILAAKTGFLDLDFPHLRMLTQAGGGMAPTLARRLHDAFKGRAELFIMYGQTEASARLSYLPPDRLADKLGSIGVAIPGVSLDILNPEGEILPAGQVGELVARGDNIMQGYWDDPQETALVLKDGALWTGDLGRKDEEGFIYLVDRIKNMIKAGANRVSAQEVEHTISEIKEVVEVCVVGVPDPLLGEAIVAHVAVYPNSNIDEKSIFAFLNSRLAAYKIPSKLIFHKELPKNASGKIDRPKLKIKA